MLDRNQRERVRPRFVFSIVAAGVLMSNLDAFVVNVALPQIGLHFHQSSLGPVSWILNAYAVVFAALLVPAGNLADRFGAKHVYMAGTALFTMSSLACSLAPGVWWLVGFRVLQATGAALLIPASLGLLLVAAPAERRQHYVRGWAALSGLGAALGPVLGGLLTEASWRWVFLINVPIGIATVLCGLALLPDTTGSNKTARFDVIGVVLLSLGIGAVAFGVVQSPTWGWTSQWVIGSFCVAAVMLCGFVLRSSRAISPVLPLKLLRVQGFAPASVCNFLFAVPFAAMLLSIALWSQQVWHWSPLAAGLAIAPGPLMVPPLAIVGGPYLVKRFGASVVSCLGCLIFALGVLSWIVAMSATPDYSHMLPGMLMTGIGVGLTLPTLIAIGLSALPPTSFSTGSSVVTMGRQIGSVIGVAALVAVLESGNRNHAATEAFDRVWWFTTGVVVLTGLACVSIRLAPRRKAETQGALSEPATSPAGRMR
jgi:EmrB/QacA subfamily drug resistance transporter